MSLRLLRSVLLLTWVLMRLAYYKSNRMRSLLYNTINTIPSAADRIMDKYDDSCLFCNITIMMYVRSW